MDNDEAHIAGDFFLNSTTTTDTIRRKTFLEYFQRFIPRQTIVYIQYCLLRIPLVLIYDYLFTEKFSSLIESTFKYSTQIIDQDHHTFVKPISYILHSSLFHILIQISLLFSVPVLGKVV